MKNNFKEFFEKLDRNTADIQYLVCSEDVVKAYYGISKDGKYRLSFLSSKPSGITQATKSIDLVQGYSNINNYWTCFDLNNDLLLPAFTSFAQDIVDSVSGANNEDAALAIMRSRYNIWKALFRGTKNQMSPEKTKGLYGELYFLKNYMVSKYGIENAISSWVGPDGFKKDFSIDNTWYEIKTIGCNVPTIKISSLQQLSSDVEGHLIVIKVEEMSEKYDVEDCSINKILKYLVDSTDSTELKDKLLNKLQNLGFDFNDNMADKKYHVQSMESYLVDKEFPVLHDNDIKSQAINNVSYELILKLIEQYAEE